MLPQTSNFNRVVDNMRERSQAPSVELKHFSLASTSAAKVILEITHRNGSRGDRKAIRRAVREKFDGNLDVVENSFVAVSSTAFADTVRGVLKAVQRSVPYVEGKTQGFTAVATNMYMDKEHALWNLKKTAGGNLLVQTSSLESEESLSDLLKGSLSMGVKLTPGYKSFCSVSAAFEAVEGGDLVSFVGARNQFSLGYVVAAVESDADDQYVVLAHDAKDCEVVRNTAILHAFDASDAPQLGSKDALRHASRSSAHEIAIKDMLAYYKMMFARRPEYYKQFEARLRSHCFM